MIPPASHVPSHLCEVCHFEHGSGLTTDTRPPHRKKGLAPSPRSAAVCLSCFFMNSSLQILKWRFNRNEIILQLRAQILQADILVTLHVHTAVRVLVCGREHCNLRHGFLLMAKWELTF